MTSSELHTIILMQQQKNNNKQQHQESVTALNKIYDSTSNLSNGDICRICHCEADLDNPLLSPCYCAGSLKYVHQSCLRQWLAASDTRSCELCKFNFILQTKIKPLSEWRTLEMSSVERRRLLCAILFHFVAAVCVIWSLFVLIDRATEEVQKGIIAWPFWTKLVVVAVGFTGGAVFMYIQCRQYLHLFARWKAHNRIILVQNAPEKPMAPPSPTFIFTKAHSPQVNPNVGSTNNSDFSVDELCYVFEKECDDKMDFFETAKSSSTSTSHKEDDIRVEDLCAVENEQIASFDACDHRKGDNERSRDILALDIQCSTSRSAFLPQHCPSSKSKTDVCSSGITRNNGSSNRSCVFKSLPNLNSDDYMLV